MCPIFVFSFKKDASASNDTIIYVFVYNPLVQNRSTIVRLPVATHAMFRMERVDSDEHITFPSVANANTQYELIFDTGPIPPMSIVVFSIVKEADDDPIFMNVASSVVRRRRVRRGSSESFEFNNGIVSASFNVSTGLLTDISADGVVVPVNQTWGYYTSFDSAFDSTSGAQNSGAYIFRPSVPDQKLIQLTPKHNAAKFEPTPVGVDVYAFFEEDWIWQVTRIQSDASYIEIEYHVGPIPINDNRGKEIVTRYSTPIRTNGEFYTDSNGREFQKRRRNFRPTWDLDVFEPVAGNYYPVNAAIYVEDSTAAFAVMVDRSQGGSSLVDGSIEIMVQRRTLADDSRGVDEPLNETCGGMTPYPPFGSRERIGDGVSIIGRHRVRVGKGGGGASIARSEMDDMFVEPIILVASTAKSNPAKFVTGMYPGLAGPLPQNIMLITFSKLDRSNATYLVRLGHQYDANEDESMSRPQVIDLSILFAEKIITSVQEMSLTGNQNLKSLQDRRLRWNENNNMNYRRSYVPTNTTSIQIFPMEVRTFEVVLSS